MHLFWTSFIISLCSCVCVSVHLFCKYVSFGSLFSYMCVSVHLFCTPVLICTWKQTYKTVIYECKCSEYYREVLLLSRSVFISVHPIQFGVSSKRLKFGDRGWRFRLKIEIEIVIGLDVESGDWDWLTLLWEGWEGSLCTQTVMWEGGELCESLTATHRLSCERGVVWEGSHVRWALMWEGSLCSCMQVSFDSATQCNTPQHTATQCNTLCSIRPRVEWKGLTTFARRNKACVFRKLI